jgi:hypothetical protein
MRGKHIRVRSELGTNNLDYVHSVQYNSQKLRFIIPLPLYDTDNTITSSNTTQNNKVTRNRVIRTDLPSFIFPETADAFFAVVVGEGINEFVAPDDGACVIDGEVLVAGKFVDNAVSELDVAA